MTRLSSLAILSLCLAGGCASDPSGGASPYRPAPQAARDPQRAQALTMRAADVIASDPKQAEELLTQALAADVYHGPAHNNLGVLLLKQGKLYEAASEFEWARKLMPGHPDPRTNLGMVLEKAGRFEEAMAMYGTALEVYPNHLATVEALVRLQVKTKKTDERTDAMLRDIALRGETSEWREWAQGRLALLTPPSNRARADLPHE